MSLDTQVNMQFSVSHVSPEKLEEIFKKISKDIKLLQEQPPLEVKRKVNYEEGNDNGVMHGRGFRTISITGGCIKGFSYTLYDRAHVVGSVETLSLVADKVYTEKDLEDLRKKR